MLLGFGPPALAFLIAGLISASELITTKYPRTYSLLIKESVALYLYALSYGAIAFGVMLGLDGLVTSQAIKLEGLGLGSPWLRAVAIGITVKALLHINLFTVSAGAHSVPIGLETIVQFFEPALLRRIMLDEFVVVRAYIQPRAARYLDLEKIKNTISESIPATLPAQERAAFANDISKATSTTETLEHFLRFMGVGIFERVFP